MRLSILESTMREPAPPTRHLTGMNRWLVLRQDDNGNVFVVGEHASEADARAEAQRFEMRAHKQRYWVEPRPLQPPRAV